jgi:SnoaL-like protein
MPEEHADAEETSFTKHEDVERRRHMQSLKVLLVGVIAVVVGGAGWIYAQQKPSAGTLSPQDYVEIYQLYGYYTRDVDPGSDRNASWLFADDGSFETPQGEKHKGPQQLKEFYETIRNRQTFGIRHVNSNFLIHPTAEGAQGTAYMIQVEQRESSKPIAVTVFGVYHDTFVKTRAGWRFKDRVFKWDGPRGK